jgi:squalene-hopene/tetraprenyl-beta-curcumene cyclase
MRVEQWNNLDNAKIELFYSSDEQKKKESWGTEAVINAVVLAFNDRSVGRTSPSKTTLRAFDNLWKTQAKTGGQKGSWEWLNFGLNPWEAEASRYYGAALAAVAVGTAPGYYQAGQKPELDARVQLLRQYLQVQLPRQNLFNRAWYLWAAAALDGTAASEQHKDVVAELFGKQKADGGWSLSSLGNFIRGDGTAQQTTSDGYATGLLLHVLQTAGVPKTDPRVAKGLTWLIANQTPAGEWRASSLNKERKPASLAGKFMTDAATAYAVLALGH